MKKTLLLLSIFISCYASGQQYQKLIRQNIYWEEFSWNNSSICFTSSASRVFFGGDTLVNNVSYSKIYHYQIFPLNQPQPFCSPFGVDTSQAFLETWYALREDTVDQKVYIYNFNAQAEYLLYDFSLQVGDTLISQHTTIGEPFVIDSIKTITTYDGVDRRIFYGNQDFVPEVKYLLEGIGSSSGMYACLFDAIYAGTLLTCVLDQDSSILPPISPSGMYMCSQVVGIDEHHQEINVSISPNPSHGLVAISHSYPGGCHINVYDLAGKLIHSENSDQQSFLLDLSELSPGIFLVEVQFQDKRVYLNKLIIIKI